MATELSLTRAKKSSQTCDGQCSNLVGECGGREGRGEIYIWGKWGGGNELMGKMYTNSHYKENG